MGITPDKFTDDDLHAMQRVILGILKDIDATCRRHGLRYYIIAGTMLGAIRHGGFVPWDDDADVAMPRPDYEKLIEHADEWLPSHLELVSSHSDPSYPYLFARIQDRRTTYILRRRFNFIGGVPVDVFPIDGMVLDAEKMKSHYRRFAFRKRLLYYSEIDRLKHGYGLHWAFTTLFQLLTNRSKLHRKADIVQREFDYETSPLLADHDNKPSRGVYKRTVFGTPTPVKFEDTTLMGVERPDEYLRISYGDYMTPPAQHPLLNFRYLDLDTPYAEFIEKHKNFRI